MPDSLSCVLGAFGLGAGVLTFVAAPPAGIWGVTVGVASVGASVWGAIDGCGSWWTTDLSDVVSIYGRCGDKICVPPPGWQPGGGGGGGGAW